MPAEQLSITLIQPDIVWENKAANLLQYEETIAAITGPKQVMVLPEMFSTAFSMQPELFAETMQGHTVEWMKKIAAEKSWRQPRIVTNAYAHRFETRT